MQRNSKYFLLLLIFLGASNCSLSIGTSSQGTSFTSSSEKSSTRALIDSGALVVDVRTPEEYKNEHLPGAVNVPHTLVLQSLEKFGSNKHRPIVVYCKSGRRAELARGELSQAGYTAVTNGGAFSELVR